MRPNKAVFLDRDGVLNKELGDYVCSAGDFEVLEHNFAPLKQLQDRGYLLIVITNQGGIAKGWYSEKDLSEMHDKLRAVYSANGITLTEIYYCRHHPQYNGNCLCRKPGSIMLEKAAARFGAEPSRSYFIGDRERDVLAGEAAGMTGILIDSDQPIGEVLHLIA
ncbi:D-glycero-alpha-D-manno-heptose-1,7-bisphosphate 7-phosphatase [Hufsiella ginkgonis]|uniref:D,D-heptose 1,7-bisphosphate phosphatase n=1 Tax=Hufsiella ginkgonis TaxID=2695274 RepID=A0A7K1XXL7_9SPHI|nr:HAD family hydrolase [Hufsiella ginkgonis]MXV15266.1 HAD-IIIA family hydrolase [Hufsiella ginkgonis]